MLLFSFIVLLIAACKKGKLDPEETALNLETELGCAGTRKTRG